jgi:thiamine-monophosphate kinase
VKLLDLGEFALLKSVVLPTLREVGPGLGDDCSIVPITDQVAIAISSDRGPQPLGWSIDGMSRDYADAGWLAVVAAISDLATAGASPLAITNDIEAPPDMDVRDLQRFVSGIAEACSSFGFRHAGGDLAAGHSFSTHCTAVGLVPTSVKTGRRCKPGNHVLVIGPLGALASAYLRAVRIGGQNLLAPERNALLRPIPQIAIMQRLVARGLIQAASDCSDGILGALLNLVAASGVGIELDLNRLQISECVSIEANLHRISPWNILFFWGDWQVVVATEYPDEITTIVAGEVPVTYLGRVIDGAPGLRAVIGDQIRRVAPIRNEHFRSTGFSGSMREHLHFMFNSSILL